MLDLEDDDYMAVVKVTYHVLMDATHVGQGSKNSLQVALTAMLAGLVESGLSPDSEFLETLAPYVLIVLREKLGAVRSHYKRMTPVDPMWHLGTASQLEKYGASNMAQALRIAKAAGLD